MLKQTERTILILVTTVFSLQILNPPIPRGFLILYILFWLILTLHLLIM